MTIILSGSTLVVFLVGVLIGHLLTVAVRG